MNRENPTKTLAGAEQEVLRALQALPPGYRTTRDAECLTIRRGNIAYSYETDFVVHDPAGRRLFVEVKTASSLSWSNLAKLVEIKREATNAGSALLVIVPGGQAEEWRRFVSEFNDVRFSYSNDEQGTIHAVLDASRMRSFR